MEPIIAPISKELIKAELTPDKKLRDTNKGGNEIYVVNFHNSPNTLREIGRIREIAYRDSGGGSGLACDLDEYDTMDTPYEQLIVWNPDADEIIGGYRFILGPDMKFDEKGQPMLSTSHLFHFSEKFLKEYLPYTIELGRSFIDPKYQRRQAGMKALFALDNVWDGLGALAIEHPKMRYFFGKMTIYPDYDTEAHDLIHHFLFKHFEDKESLVVPKVPILLKTDKSYMDNVLTADDFKSDYVLLNSAVRKRGVNIPPLVNAYMSLSASMKMFGGAINHELSDIEDTGIMIEFDEIREEKIERHITSYINEKIGMIKVRFPKFVENMGNNLRNMMENRRKRVQARREKRALKKNRRK